MDKLVSYIILVVIAAFIIIGGNHFLTDDVGNFSMEKARNLIPNIEIAIIEKKNEFLQTRDINKDMTVKKEAERLNIEGSTANKQSVTEQYMNEMNALDDDWTSFQKNAILKEIQDKYLGERFYWSGNVSDVKEYNGRYIILSMKFKGHRWNTLFCEMTINNINLISIRDIKKNDNVTVTGDYIRSDENPWLKDCEIVKGDS